MATIKDIAQLTGVSTATVSNVLNGKTGAASAAKAREIMDIARSLHYTPNSLAKSLKIQKSNTIGIITEDLTVFNTPEIVDGIDDYCEANGYEIILGNMRLFKRYNNDFTDTPRHQQFLDEMVSNMLSKQVEGIIYVGYHCREITYLPTRLNVPFVYAYCYPKEKVYPSVMFDDAHSAQEVTNVLIRHNHTKIGVITGPLTSSHSISRLSGYKKALSLNNIQFNENLVVNGDWERQSGYRLAGPLIDEGVTAIFAFNDLMASGVYEYCSERKLVVGQDISLFGYDNREISYGYSPPISTVEPPLSAIGHRSAELILKQINRKKVSCDPVYLPCIIHERNSVCPANITV